MTTNPRQKTELFAEASVLTTWPMLAPAELRRARKSGALTFYAFASGPHYTVDDVEAYIAEKYRTCGKRKDRQSAGHTGPITSTGPILSAAAHGTPAGMTPDLAQSTGEAFAQRILSRQSKSSSRSQSSRPSPSKPHPAPATF